ncbi:MAG: tail fiber domain-containing protein [Gammaproteobacteria bacterium]|nr:tail fiber domain-containing protein [Gammaproteobacteria bacterium]
MLRIGHKASGITSERIGSIEDELAFQVLVFTRRFSSQLQGGYGILQRSTGNGELKIHNQMEALMRLADRERFSYTTMVVKAIKDINKTLRGIWEKSMFAIKVGEAVVTGLYCFTKQMFCVIIDIIMEVIHGIFTLILDGVNMMIDFLNTILCQITAFFDLLEAPINAIIGVLNTIVNTFLKRIADIINPIASLINKIPFVSFGKRIGFESVSIPNSVTIPSTLKLPKFSLNDGRNSDFRFKKTIKPISQALDTVLKLEGVRFEWKEAYLVEHNFAQQQEIGFIAQQVEKVLPEVVFVDEKGFRSVAYDKLVALLIEAEKEQAQEIAELQHEVAQLKMNFAI